MMPVKCWSSLSCVSRFSRSINLHFIPLNLIRRVLSASSTSAKVNAANLEQVRLFRSFMDKDLAIITAKLSSNIRW